MYIRLLMLSMIFYTSTGLGQEVLRGTYITAKSQREFQTEIFSFDGKRGFQYFKNACGRPNVGQGKYEIADDSLILRFEKNEYYKENYTISFQQSDDRATVIKLEIFDEAGLPMAGVNCSIKEEKAGTITNENGQGELIVRDRYTRRRTLVISYIGYSDMEIPLDSKRGIYQVQAHLDFRYYFLPGDVRKYKIIKTGKRLVFRKPGSEDEVYYNRTSRSSLKKMIKKHY